MICPACRLSPCFCAPSMGGTHPQSAKTAMTYARHARERKMDDKMKAKAERMAARMVRFLLDECYGWVFDGHDTGPDGDVVAAMLAALKAEQPEECPSDNYEVYIQHIGHIDEEETEAPGSGWTPVSMTTNWANAVPVHWVLWRRIC